MAQFDYECLKCKKHFKSHKKNKKYCSHFCYAKRFGDVTNLCVICEKDFSVPYRFRGKKTCNIECTKIFLSKFNTTKVIKQCVNCNIDFEVIQSSKDSRLYCSYSCFLATRKSRQNPIIKQCENCNCDFTISLTKEKRRFCSRTCATSGKYNGVYGKPGSLLGRKAWNNGLTAKTDERLKQLGQKISIISKQKFADGSRSHIGIKNPMYGRTADKLTPEQIATYSKAAVKRILNGQSGYGTHNLHGEFFGKKSLSVVNFKSSWELAIMMWWEKQDYIKSYQYEPFYVKLANGKYAVPDFLVKFIDDNEVIFEIKPTAIQNLTEVKNKLILIREAINLMGYDYVLIGDNEIFKIKNDLGLEYENEFKRYKDR